MSSAKRSKPTNAQTRAKRASIDTVSGPSRLLQEAAALNQRDFTASLELANQLNNSGRAAEVIPLLVPFEIRYPFDNVQSCAQYDRLLGFGHASVKQWVEAEHHLQRGRKLYPKALDFLYGLAYVFLSLRNHKAAIETGEAYLAVADGSTRSALAELPFNGALAQRPLLYNYLGLAYQELGYGEKAIAAFRQAISADPTTHHPYLNLANHFVRSGQPEFAKTVVDDGLAACLQVQELRMLAAALSAKATISACLIVKNEEELLPDCLESIRSWVDEIIVVDTGSTDRTMEIARSYGARVYEHPWEGSFSKARNYSLQYATKDWLFIIDADERVYQEDIAQIAAAVNQTDADVITTNVFNVYEEIRDVVVFLPSHRFFRRSLNIRYDGIVHNQLVIAETARYLRSGIRIKHLGYGLSREKMQAKTTRTKTLLEKQLAEDPDNAFALFNYAQLLRSTPDGFNEGFAPLILNAAGRAIQLTQPDNPANRHIHLMCLDQLAWTHYYMGEHDKALEYSQRALDIKADYLDPILLRGYLYFKLNDLTKSTFYFEKYLTTQAAYDPSREMENIILVHLNARTDAYFNLGAMAEMRGETENAKRYYRQALAINQEYVGANLNLGRLLLTEGHHSEAEECLQRVVEHNQATPDIFAKLAQLFLEKGEVQRAAGLLLNALKKSPNDETLLLAIAELYAGQGKYDEVVQSLHQAWQTNSASRDLTIQLANAMIQAGKVNDAITVYNRYAAGHPLSGEMLNDLGNCYYRQKNFAEAESSYRRAFETAPQLAVAKRNLGLAMAMQGKSPEALGWLQSYLKDDPEQTEIQHVIADLYAAAGNYGEALTHYELYLQRHPSDSSALYRLSDCYLQLGHRDSAILGFRRVLQLDPAFQPAEAKLAELLGSVGIGGESASKGKVS